MLFRSVVTIEAIEHSSCPRWIPSLTYPGGPNLMCCCDRLPSWPMNQCGSSRLSGPAVVRIAAKQHSPQTAKGQKLTRPPRYFTGHWWVQMYCPRWLFRSQNSSTRSRWRGYICRERHIGPGIATTVAIGGILMWFWSVMAWVSLAVIAYVIWKLATGQPLTPTEQALLHELGC